MRIAHADLRGGGGGGCTVATVWLAEFHTLFKPVSFGITTGERENCFTVKSSHVFFFTTILLETPKRIESYFYGAFAKSKT